MIATLKGIVSEKLPDVVVLDVNGVGYGLLMANEDYGMLNLGQISKVYIYEHIREQLHDLFGFSKIETKNLFEKLLAVNGVGPKMALNILNIGSANAVKSAIASGDVKFICQANGVGKRVAERVVIELKDKVGLDGIDLTDSGLLQNESFASKDEAVQALSSLGYSLSDSVLALNGVDKDLPTGERVKLALKGVK
jgi:Holliday junction DNA helicase RuvA